MNNLRNSLGRAVGVALFGSLALSPNVAQAYIGPGMGVGAAMGLLALIGAFVFLFVGLVWFPLKRKMSSREQPETKD